MMLGSLLRRAVRKAWESPKVEAIFNDAIDRTIANNPRIQFVKAMQMQMLACDPKMDPREAWNAAVGALKAFCEEENCEFGDSRHDWSRDGAVTLIHEYEICHWEPAP